MFISKRSAAKKKELRSAFTTCTSMLLTSLTHITYMHYIYIFGIGIGIGFGIGIPVQIVTTCANT